MVQLEDPPAGGTFLSDLDIFRRRVVGSGVVDFHPEKGVLTVSMFSLLSMSSLAYVLPRLHASSFNAQGSVWRISDVLGGVLEEMYSKKYVVNVGIPAASAARR